MIIHSSTFGNRCTYELRLKQFSQDKKVQLIFPNVTTIFLFHITQIFEFLVIVRHQNHNNQKTGQQVSKLLAAESGGWETELENHAKLAQLSVAGPGYQTCLVHFMHGTNNIKICRIRQGRVSASWMSKQRSAGRYPNILEN